MTDKEIIQTLRICATHIENGCGLCPQMKYVRCTERMADEAITVIERLTAERAAALADLADARSCKTCKYACDTRDCSSCKSKTCKCLDCHLDKNAWEWRGLPEAPEEGEKA